MQTNVLNTDLTGKVAVVTDAGGVLCSVLAKVLSRAGAKVALLNRTWEHAEHYAQEIRAEGGIAKAYAGDITDWDRCYAVAEEVQRDFAPVTSCSTAQVATIPKRPQTRNTMKAGIWIPKQKPSLIQMNHPVDGGV